MGNKLILIAASALLVGAAIFFAAPRDSGRSDVGGGRSAAARPGFVATDGARFVIDNQPFRFVGANVALMYREEDRKRMPETLREAAGLGIRVLRVWAYGEGGEDSPIKSLGGDREDWPRQHPFRRAPNEWNEEAFVHLDQVLVEARRNNLRVQLCLVNWWRDTGGVTQYLHWAGIKDAADARYPYGINPERAMLFYTNEETRRLYREHVERIVTRRNSVSGTLYRDDPTIMSYELMNEAQAVAGRWHERRQWVSEMSAYIKSLDPHHLVTSGTWGFRSAFERREWLAEHRLPTIDYSDVHHYPRDDHDVFVESPQALREFIDNRAAASLSIKKPLVLGEFGMGVEGYKDFSQAEWFRAYFEGALEAGAGGAMFWILTPDPRRGYGVTYTTPRDKELLEEIRRAAAVFASRQGDPHPARLLSSEHHLIPRQFAFTRAPDDASARPFIETRKDGTILYRFKPEQAAATRFEKLGGGEGYIWGAGVGHVEYTVPAREDWRRVGEIVVRAYIQPVPSTDARPEGIATRVTLFINGTNCGSRLVPGAKDPKQVNLQEWRIDSWPVRLHAARGKQLSVRFATQVFSDKPNGINISNWPEGYDAKEAKPVEVEVR
jgi:mannan endo-1,4-beta-mannosidase